MKCHKILFYTIFTIFFHYCNAQTSTQNEGSQKLLKVCIISNLAMNREKGKTIEHFPDSIVIYSYKDISVLNSYEFHREILLKEGSQKDEEGEIVLKSESKKWAFFVFRKGDQMGLFFDSIGSPSYKSLSSDSFVKKHQPGVMLLPSSIYSEWTLISEIKSNRGVKEILSIKSPESSRKSLFLTMEFSQDYEGVNYSLSKEFDSLKNNRLFKIMIQETTSGQISNSTNDSLKALIEMKLLPIDASEKKTIMDLIEKYREENSLR